jgi:protease-4
MQDMNANDISSHLATELLKEKRSDRRWRNFRFLVWLSLICFVIFKWSNIDSSSMPISSGKTKPVALIRLTGMIAPGKDFSAETVIPTLKDAYEDKHTSGVILLIDSPGGTPVQAAIIHDAIVAYKNKYHKKTIVIGEDMLTSGAYYVAVAADKIYVNPNTIAGSIGVIVKGFGFVDLMKKLGVERRVYTSVSDKDRLDPFLPQSEADVAKIQEVMSDVQANFAKAVTEGRKGKLHGTPEQLFTGDFWSGQKALELGLVDGLGNLMDVSQSEFNTNEFHEFNPMPAVFKMLGGSFSSSLDRALYSFA